MGPPTGGSLASKPSLVATTCILILLVTCLAKTQCSNSDELRAKSRLTAPSRLPSQLAVVSSRPPTVHQDVDAQQVNQRLTTTNDIFAANLHHLHQQVGETGADLVRSTATPTPAKHDDDRLSPVILLPGDGGSRLKAKLDRKNVQHYYCEKTSTDWFDLWLNLSSLVPFALDCWVDNMKLIYNATSRRTVNSPGVTTRVDGFGRTESVEFVDPAKVVGTSYFDSIVRQLIDLGYERDKNIFGAPYDFRRAPNELQDYFADLKQLVERAYRENGNERVVFVCHSMGCLNSLYFFHKQPASWKDKYIRSMISLAGVWGGSIKAMKAFASGDNFGVVVIPSLSLRKDVRTFPSLAYLLPSDEVWPKDAVLLRNGNKTYTVADYRRFFNDIGFPTGYEMWSDVHNLTSPSVAPGVEVHCLYGKGVNTIRKLNYDTNNFPDDRPKIEHGDGDGTVNLISLRACASWAGKQSQPIHHEPFDNVDHMSILTHKRVLQYLGEALAFME